MDKTLLPYLSNNTTPSALQITHGALKNHIDPQGPPRKKKPQSTIHNQPHSHTVDVILPTEILSALQHQTEPFSEKWGYAKAYMSLADVLDAPFFSAYVKNGRALMLSEGRRGVDEIFEVHDGKLVLELDRLTYERAGLVGKPIRHAGRKHSKERYRIEEDMRPPHMTHGKKGFERILRAARDVLSASKAWLFFNHAATSRAEAEAGLIQKHHPLWYNLVPEISPLGQVRVPRLPYTARVDDPDAAQNASPYTGDVDFSAELCEWLALVGMDSPRVRASDGVDPYICRYVLPELADEGAACASDEAVVDLTRLRWSGFVPASFVFVLFVAMRKAVVGSKGAATKNDAGADNAQAMDVDGEQDEAGDTNTVHSGRWATLAASGFKDEHFTILLPPGGGEFVEWTHQQQA